MKGNYYISSFFWSAAARIVSAVVGFVSLPLLLKFYGIENYGVLTLAIATNAYMALLDLGINTGAVKYFAQWRSEGREGMIDRVARTSLSFYGIIGLLNALILIVVAFFGEGWFVLTPAQFADFRVSLLILALFAVVNWCGSVFNQLLVADEKIAVTQKVLVAKSLLELTLVFAVLQFGLGLNRYFFALTLIGSAVIVPYYVACRRAGLVRSFTPAFHWDEFGVVLRYSLAIFAMSVFQITALRSRPIILGIFSDEGIGILSQYRIIEVFPVVIISLGGILISILLPKSSKAVAQGDRAKIELFAYEGTRYASVVVTALCIPVMLCAGELLGAYVGPGYAYLRQWLVLWCFTLLVSLYNSPVASLVLATGKTRMLVYSTAVACVVSMAVNAALCRWLGVGSAVTGYFVYVLIQQCFYYFYFNEKVLGLRSWRVFREFAAPTLVGLAAYGVLWFVDIDFVGDMGADRVAYIAQGALKGLLWLAMYAGALYALRIVDVKRVRNLFGL